MVSEMSEMNNESVDMILVEDLDMRKGYVKVVPRILMHDQNMMQQNPH
jgi:hypothetical protein